MSKRLMLLVGLAAATAAFGSVMDEAKFWWKFDQGGADGAVVQTSEIHDCRDASVGVASRTSGPSGGPIWTNMTVQLPYRGLEVQSSAINIQVITNASKQIRPSMVDVSGCVNSDVATFFARVCPGETLNDGVNYVGTDERFIFNDNFYWGNSKANSYGYLFGFARRNATSYYPKIFIGQEQDTFSGIALETGKWYDLAFSVSMVTNMTSTTHTDITTNDVTGVTTTNVTTSVTTSIVQRALCVVAGENGLFYQTADNAYQRQVPFAGTTGRIGGQQFVSSWVTSVGGNQVNAKDYNGLIHEMALWNRAMNLGEILNVFGRPEAPEGGDVFTDVFRWWKFDRDLDGDGKVSANELRDVRKWGRAGGGEPGSRIRDGRRPAHVAEHVRPQARARRDGRRRLSVDGTAIPGKRGYVLRGLVPACAVQGFGRGRRFDVHGPHLHYEAIRLLFGREIVLPLPEQLQLWER